MPEVTRVVLWSAAFVTAALLGRNTLVASQTGVFGPPVAIALLWLASGSLRSWRVIGPLMILLGLVVALGSGDDPLVALLSLVLLLPAPAVLLGMRRLAPQLWGGGGRRPPVRPAEFGVYLMLVVASTVLSASIRTGLGVALLAEDWSLLWLRAGRATASLVAFGAFGLLLGGILARGKGAEAPPRWRTRMLAELLAVSAVMAAWMWFTFARHPQAPTLFILALGVVWVSLRFPPVVAAGFALGVSLAAIVFTAQGYGPLDELASAEGKALVTQFFVVVMTVTALVVGLSREQLSATVERLVHAEEGAARRMDELVLMLENLTDGVAIIEQGGRFVHTNSALRRLFPQTAAPPGGGDAYVQPAETYHLYKLDGQSLAEDDLPYLRALAGEPIERQDFHLVSADDGSRRTVEILAVALPVEPGRPRRVMVSVRDVSVEREHREDLTRFAGTVAHDLNSPLTVLSGWADLLRDEFSRAEVVPRQTAEPMLASIQSSVGRMQELIADLLGHAVAVDRHLRCEYVDLHELVAKLAAARTDPLTTTPRVKVAPLPRVWGDSALLSQVFDNLIGNALKYVEPGRAPLVQVTDESRDPSWVTVRVRDNGIGIPVDQRDQVFEQFHRGGGVGYDGTGLGLAICKRIVERHGGHIWVGENPDGGGSVFELTLPATAAAFTAHQPT